MLWNFIKCDDIQRDIRKALRPVQDYQRRIAEIINMADPYLAS